MRMGGVVRRSWGGRYRCSILGQLCFPHQYQARLAYISIINLSSWSKMEPSASDHREQAYPPHPIHANHQETEEFLHWQQQFLVSLPPQVTASTYLVQLQNQDIDLPEVYRLNDRILEGSPISENMRARIRSFLMSEASKQWVMRDSLALACTYLDLFFNRQKQDNHCPVSELQTLSIACLILAQKMLDGKFPKISFDVFRKQDLLAWEKKLAKVLQYRLSPPTYLTLAENVVLRWDSFSQGSPYRSQVRETPQGPNLRLRSLYQQLDCVFMVLKSLSWSLEDLVVNLCYLHLRRLNFPELPEAGSLSDEHFLERYYTRDEFQIFFNLFLREYSRTRVIVLLPDLGVFLKPFLALRPSSKVFPIKHSLDHLRLWEKLQTCPAESYPLFKSILERRSHGQI